MLTRIRTPIEAPLVLGSFDGPLSGVLAGRSDTGFATKSYFELEFGCVYRLMIAGYSENGSGAAGGAAGIF